jgi:hypothetical protein
VTCHCVRFTRARLPISENAHVVPVEKRLYQFWYVTENLLLRVSMRKHPIELEKLTAKYKFLLAYVLD